MNGTKEKSLNIGYINLRAQTGFGLPKQIQVEQFLKSYKIDILHLQEAQIRIHFRCVTLLPATMK